MGARGSDWDRLAAGYGRQEPLERAAVAAALRLAAARRDDVLLDVATGTGLVLRMLAELPGRPGRATGVDPSAGMRTRVGPLPGGWTLVEGDAAALPATDASVDVVTCGYLLHLLDASMRETALAEIRRVLRPGGRAVLVTPWSPRAPVRAVLDALAAVAPERLDGLRTLDPRPELAAAGLAARRAVVSRRGYPSLVVLAERG